MGAMASQITSLTIVYSTVYLGSDQRRHQSSASLAFLWGIHRDRWIPRIKGQLRGKYFHLMTSSSEVDPYLTCTSCVTHLRIEQYILFKLSPGLKILKRHHSLQSCLFLKLFEELMTCATVVHMATPRCYRGRGISLDFRLWYVSRCHQNIRLVLYEQTQHFI